MSGSELVVLAAGPVIPLAALQLAWELEEKGVSLKVDGDWLIARPRRLLTDVERQAIRRWRKHLMALATYQPPKVQ